ncbi:MAG: Sensor protein ZraS [Candidatus Omnitrophica bacterium ADurb.Bin277]|nr:MAG: Sensor protein ZraS [Candidatus Omnitrophica bacterium ADurb.Bin277]
MNSIFDPNQYYWNVYALPHFIVGVLIILEGLFVFLQGKRTVTHVAYAITNWTAGIWLTGVGIVCSMTDETAAVIVSRWYTWFGIIFITPAVYFFIASWDPGFLRRKAKWVVIHYFCALGFYLACGLTPWIVATVYPYSTGFFPKAGPLEGVFIVWFYALMILSFANFMRICRKADTPILKKNTKLMFVAYAIAFLGSIEYLPNYGIHIFPVAFLPMFVFTTIIGYCVIRYRLMDIETVIHKTVMWFVTSAVAVLPFAGIISSVQPMMRDLKPAAAGFYFLAMLFIFYFYYRAVQPRLDRLFQWRQTNLMAVLDGFLSELVHLKNIRDLLQSFSRLMRRELFVRRLSVYLYDEQSKHFVPAIAKGIRSLRPVPQGSRLLQWLAETDGAVIGELAVSDPAVDEFRSEMENFFSDTGTLAVLPFVLGDRLIGFANLGRKSNLRRYGFNEIRFLNRLKVPVTIALSNSMRYEDIRKLSDELQLWNQALEERVDQRTRELAKTQEQLVQAEKLATLGTLAGGVAHEINNPLTAVLTNAQILRMSAREDDIESISLIEEGAKRCQGIVHKLMKYARKTTEEAPLKAIDLGEVVKGTVALLGFQFKQENIEVKTRLAKTPPVRGIAGEIEQVLTNLLVNAKDAILAVRLPASAGNTAPGQGKIIIETRKAPDAVELIVTDDGAGIPKENLKKIFDPFFTTRDVGAGTGLGLSVSLGILKRHGAAISVVSEPGRGSAFTIRFPDQDPVSK